MIFFKISKWIFNWKILFNPHPNKTVLEELGSRKTTPNLFYHKYQ